MVALPTQCPVLAFLLGSVQPQPVTQPGNFPGLNFLIWKMGTILPALPVIGSPWALLQAVLRVGWSPVVPEQTEFVFHFHYSPLRTATAGRVHLHCEARGGSENAFPEASLSSGWAGAGRGRGLLLSGLGAGGGPRAQGGPGRPSRDLLPPSCPAHSLSSLAFLQSDPRPARLSLAAAGPPPSPPWGLRLNRCYLKWWGCLLRPGLPTVRQFPSLLGLWPQ